MSIKWIGVGTYGDLVAMFFGIQADIACSLVEMYEEFASST
jgi:hypothetical protein